MRELERLYELVSRAGTYAYLHFSTDTSDPERGALLQRVQEADAAIETRILFLELEWAALPDERAEELMRSDTLAFCRHYLETARRYRPHLLTQPEERVMTEKGVTGRSAWTRLFSEQVSAVRVSLPDRTGDVSPDGVVPLVVLCVAPVEPVVGAAVGVEESAFLCAPISMT